MLWRHVLWAVVVIKDRLEYKSGRGFCPLFRRGCRPIRGIHTLYAVDSVLYLLQGVDTTGVLWYACLVVGDTGKEAGALERGEE